MLRMFAYFISIYLTPHIFPYKWSTNRGRTDKKLTSTLVIWTFLSFELVDSFKSMGVICFSKKQKKNSNFHPHRQRQQKQGPLDPARHDYAVSTPERLHFLGLSLHGGITSACSNSGENFPCLIRRLRKPCAFFVIWWILTYTPGCHQETV